MNKRDIKPEMLFPAHYEDRDQTLTVMMVGHCVLDEVTQARLKFPTNKHKLAALFEEVGELANALLEHERGNDTPEHVFQEAIQVASTVLRLAMEGDHSFPKYRPTKDVHDKFFKFRLEKEKLQFEQSKKEKEDK